MKHREGDLLDLAEGGAFDVIAHGCNCFHTMGAGIAMAIAARFPEALEVDQATPPEDRTKLGTISTATVLRGDHSFTIVNAYTQFHYSGPGPHLDYDAVAKCFEKVAAQYAAKRIGYPLIGAGLAGGDWPKIAGIIEAKLQGLDHTLVTLPGTDIPAA